MSSNDYDVYISKVIRLVRSLVIKSVQNIDAMNQFLLASGHELNSDPKEWKYYKNLYGEYYSSPIGIQSANDTLMTITSLDDLSTIDFTKQSLQLHPFTLQEYRKYGRFYNQLVDAYPDQVDLIRGILQPIDKTTAVEANDYSILWYDVKEVDRNEIQLIPKLTEWLQTYTARWLNPNYTYSDPYYASNALGCLAPHLISAIINIQLKYTKTQYVSEFHVWQYLGGFFEIGKYKNIIPYKQALWLYRNIDDIAANIGSRETLEYLNKHFAKPFGLSLTEFTLNKNHTELVTTYQTSLLTMYGNLGEGTRSITNVDNLVNLTKYYAVRNEELTDEQKLTLNRLIRMTPNDGIEVSVIEANMRHNNLQGIVSEFIESINQWIYLAHVDKYKYLITLDVPKTNGLQLSMSQAIILFLFCCDRANGGTEDIIPNPIYAAEIPLIDPSLSVYDVKAMVKARVEDKYWSDELYTEIIRDLPNPPNIFDLGGFVDYIAKVANRKIMYSVLLSKQPSESARIQIQQAIYELYQDVPCTLTNVNYTTFTMFLDYLQLDVSMWSRSDYGAVALNILGSCINYRVDTEGMPSPYYEMMEILRILTRYTTIIVPGRGQASSSKMVYPDFNWDLDPENNRLEVEAPGNPPDLQIWTNDSISHLVANYADFGYKVFTAATDVHMDCVQKWGMEYSAPGNLIGDRYVPFSTNYVVWDGWESDGLLPPPPPIFNITWEDITEPMEDSFSTYSDTEGGTILSVSDFIPNEDGDNWDTETTAIKTLNAVQVFEPQDECVSNGFMFKFNNFPRVNGIAGGKVTGVTYVAAVDLGLDVDNNWDITSNTFGIVLKYEVDEYDFVYLNLHAVGSVFGTINMESDLNIPLNPDNTMKIMFDGGKRGRGRIKVFADANEEIPTYEMSYRTSTGLDLPVGAFMHHGLALSAPNGWQNYLPQLGNTGDLNLGFIPTTMDEQCDWSTLPDPHNITVEPWFGEYIPHDMVLLDGSIVDPTEYADIFEFIGPDPNISPMANRLYDLRGEHLITYNGDFPQYEVGRSYTSKLMYHSHSLSAYRGNARLLFPPATGHNTAVNTSSNNVLRTRTTGGGETRMKNIACNWLMSRDIHGNRRLIGEIVYTLTDYPVVGSFVCDGSELDVSEHYELHGVIGYTYGSSGPNKFNIPNLLGRVVRVTDNGNMVDPDALTRTNRGDGTIGDSVGTLQEDQLLSHSHTVDQSPGTIAVNTEDLGIRHYGTTSKASKVLPIGGDPNWDTGSNFSPAGNRLTGAILTASIVYTDDPVVDSDVPDIVPRSVNPGTIKIWATDNIPSGYIRLTRTYLSINDHPELFSIFGFKFGQHSLDEFYLPAVDGRVLRGTDNGRGRDPDALTRTNRGDGTIGDSVGTLQEDAFASHYHRFPRGTSMQDGNAIAGAVNTATRSIGAFGGSETRMKNIYMNLIIKTTDERPKLFNWVDRTSEMFEFPNSTPIFADRGTVVMIRGYKDSTSFTDWPNKATVVNTFTAANALPDNLPTCSSNGFSVKMRDLPVVNHIVGGLLTTVSYIGAANMTNAETLETDSPSFMVALGYTVNELGDETYELMGFGSLFAEAGSLPVGSMVNMSEVNLSLSVTDMVSVSYDEGPNGFGRMKVYLNGDMSTPLYVLEYTGTSTAVLPTGLVIYSGIEAINPNGWDDPTTPLNSIGEMTYLINPLVVENQC